MRSVNKTKRPGGIRQKVSLDLSLTTVNWAEFQNNAAAVCTEQSAFLMGPSHPTPYKKKAMMGFDGQKMEEITKRR